MASGVPTSLVPVKHNHFATESGGITYSLALLLLALRISWPVPGNYIKSKILMLKLAMNLSTGKKIFTVYVNHKIGIRP